MPISYYEIHTEHNDPNPGLARLGAGEPQSFNRWTGQWEDNQNVLRNMDGWSIDYMLQKVTKARAMELIKEWGFKPDEWDRARSR